MHTPVEITVRFCEGVLEPLKAAFIGKDEIIDLMGVALIGGENLFLFGPPGTAKSALVRQLAERLNGSTFDYLLTRFSEPNELFGPFDIRKLRDGELITNTEGMLPEADFVFLDELLNANSAVLNSLLMVLNERVFRRGRETRPLPTLMVVGASNHLPEDEALAALFDRFLLRVNCVNVASEQLPDVLTAGWALDQRQNDCAPTVTCEEIRQLQSSIYSIDLNQIQKNYVELIHRLRHAGIRVSDRRAVKLQRLVAASAVLCQRNVAQVSDLWVLRYIWDTEEQQTVLKTIVDEALNGSVDQQFHPQASLTRQVDPEHIARDLNRIEEKINNGLHESERNYVQDQIGLITGRCEWIVDDVQRDYLLDRITNLRATWEGAAS